MYPIYIISLHTYYVLHKAIQGYIHLYTAIQSHTKLLFWFTAASSVCFGVIFILSCCCYSPTYFRLFESDNRNYVYHSPNMVHAFSNPSQKSGGQPGARFSKVPKLFGCQKSLCIFNGNTFRALKLCSYFVFSFIWNILKERVFTASGS